MSFLSKLPRTCTWPQLQTHHCVNHPAQCPKRCSDGQSYRFWGLSISKHHLYAFLTLSFRFFFLDEEETLVISSLSFLSSKSHVYSDSFQGGSYKTTSSFLAIVTCQSCLMIIYVHGSLQQAFAHTSNSVLKQRCIRGIKLVTSQVTT